AVEPELATTVPPMLVQLIVEFVAPAATDVALTRMLVSGVSLNACFASLPSPHVEFFETVTVWAVVVSIEYPVGAPVSWTEEFVPVPLHGNLSTQTVPLAPVVAGLAVTAVPPESLIVKVAPLRFAVPGPVQTPLLIVGVLAPVQALSFPVLVIRMAPSCCWL